MNNLELLILSKTQYKYIIRTFLSSLNKVLAKIISVKHTKVLEEENLLNRLFSRGF